MDSDGESTTVSTMEENNKAPPSYMGHPVGTYGVKSRNLSDNDLVSMEKKNVPDMIGSNPSYPENYYESQRGQGEPLLHARRTGGGSTSEASHHPPPPHGYYGYHAPPPHAGTHSTSLSTNNLLLLLVSAVALAGVVHFGSHSLPPASVMMPSQVQQHQTAAAHKKSGGVDLGEEVTDEEMNQFILQQKGKNKGLRGQNGEILEGGTDDETEGGEEQVYVGENDEIVDTSGMASSEMKSNGFLTGKKKANKKKMNKKGFYDLNDDMAMPNQMNNNINGMNMLNNNMQMGQMMNNQQGQQVLVPVYDSNGNPMLDPNGNIMMVMQPMQQNGMGTMQGKNNMMNGMNQMSGMTQDQNNMMMNNQMNGMMQGQNNMMMNNQMNGIAQGQNNMMMNNQMNGMMQGQTNTMAMDQQMPAQQVPAMQQQTVVTTEDSSVPAVIDTTSDEAGRSEKFPLVELQNFKNNWEPWERSDVPIFFHIPKAGGSTVKDIIGTCHRFVMATEMGITDGHANETEIAVVYPGGGPVGQDRSPFVNVDTTTLEGIARAKEMGFADSGLADAVVTPFIYEANDLFTPTAKGRLFTVFRHPIDRAISMFYYIQIADWEPTYDPELKDWTIAQYAQSSKIENNWLTRQLSNQLEGDLMDEHLELAMEVIRRKFMVGLMTQIEETMERFERFFHWTYHVNPPNQEKCRESLLKGGSNKNSSKKDKPQPGSEDWELLVWQNKYDLQLYEYIEVLFKEQEQFVADIPVGFRLQDATCCKCGPPTFPPEGFTCPLAILN